MTYLWIALGGALGSVARFWLNGLVAVRLGENFPWGTLLINVLGSFAIGVFTSIPPAQDVTRKFLMVGICGGFTTFSAFSLQTLELTQRGEWLRAGANVVGSVVLCLVAVWLGHLCAVQNKLSAVAILGKLSALMQQINLGMIGGGTVGSGVFHALQLNGGLMAARLGVKLAFRKIAVKAFDEPRPYPIARALMTTDWQEVVNDPQIHVVIELVGGTGIAKTMVLAALAQGKTVVTANKALISACGPELFAAAAKHGVNLYYEASVCGGIPIIKSLREGFVANQFSAIYGIVNGTCNYILTRMKLEGADFAAVLADAQQQGYAETPPDLDIDGCDAQHKTGILASLAHGFWVDHHQIHTEGIRDVSKIDMQFAQQLGYTIKLLGIVKQSKVQSPKSKAGVQVSVYPALIPSSHVLASVNGVFNACFVRGDVVGDTLFYGRGAGKDATASAVLSDVADAALDLKNGGKVRVPPFVAHAKTSRVVPMDEIVSQYYVRFSVIDKPGTLAKISAIFAAAKIGISSVIQPEGHEGESVPLILMIHDAPNAAMRKALAKIAKLPVVKGKPVMFRVESLQ